MILKSIPYGGVEGEGEYVKLICHAIFSVCSRKAYIIRS